MVRMSTSSAQAAAFYREVIREGAVWGVRDDGGFPAPLNSEGDRVMPFWSLQSRAEKVIQNVPAYGGFTAVRIPLAEWRDQWLPGMSTDRVRAGINWSGDRATGYDVLPAEVEAALAAADA
jgi:hypothetical protein